MLSLQDRTPDKMRLIFLGDGATLERPVDDEMLERTPARSCARFGPT